MNDKHMKSHDIVVRDGELMAIIRPDDAAKSLAMGNEIKRAQSAGEITPDEAAQRFDGIISAQPYIYVGVPTKQGDIVDPITGEKLGTVQAGDSFVPFAEIQALHESQG